MQKEHIKRFRTERIRGQILQILYYGRPQVLEAGMVRSVLAEMTYPLLLEDFVTELDYLRQERLIYCFPSGNQELDNLEQSKLLQEYASGVIDCVFLKLRTDAIKFIEGAHGHRTDLAVARV